MLHALNCPNCGAPLSPAAGGQIIFCGYCKTSFRVPHTYTPQPDMGDLLLGADFSHKPIHGWEFLNENKTQLIPGHKPALQGSFEPSDLVHYVLHSSGWFDNFDASVTLRFTAGILEYIRGGFLVRYNKERGGYIIFISAQATYKMGYYMANADKKLEWFDLFDWTSHTALRPGLNQDNRLRVILDGSRISIYLNGVLATSITDERHTQGQIRLALEPGEKTEIVAQFSDLQVRKVPPGI